MPRKIREFKRELKQHGFTWRPGKGRHQVWSHVRLNQPIVISRRDGDDTPKYLEAQLQVAIALLGQGGTQ